MFSRKFCAPDLHAAVRQWNTIGFRNHFAIEFQLSGRPRTHARCEVRVVTDGRVLGVTLAGSDRADHKTNDKVRSRNAERGHDGSVHRHASFVSCGWVPSLNSFMVEARNAAVHLRKVQARVRIGTDQWQAALRTRWPSAAEFYARFSPSRNRAGALSGIVCGHIGGHSRPAMVHWVALNVLVHVPVVLHPRRTTSNSSPLDSYCE